MAKARLLKAFLNMSGFGPAALLLLAGCAHTAQPAPQSAPAPAPLRIYGMHQTIELAPVHVAADRIYPGGVAVRNGGIPNLFSADPAALADVATHAETQALRNSLDHPDVRIILTITRGHYRIVARRSSGIASLADLRGKRIASMMTTSAGFYLHQALRSVGLSEADVTISSAPTPRDISRPLIDRQVDALAIWEPEAEIAMQALGEDAIEFRPDIGYDELFNLNTTAGNLADPVKRAQIVRFVAAIIQAAAQSRSDPAPGIAMVAAVTRYPEALVRASWPHHSFIAAVAPDLLDILVREEVWLAAQTGRPARDRAALAALIDPGIEREARALLAREQSQ
jgi:sulfonate transport system substrate-binding protein